MIRVNSFCIDIFEVTNAQFAELSRRTIRRIAGPESD